jgi:hypothetical protein
MPPVILDSKFVGADKGLVPPLRRLQVGTFSLEISNLDRADPPDYTAGSVPRSAQFNRNVFALTNTSGMPRLDVVCTVRGFDPAVTPIIWRLETSYVVGRYEKTNHSDADPEYKSLVESFHDEWTGEAHGDSFSLFSPDRNVTYDNRTDRVAGGNAILTVAGRPSGATDWLQDYVHLRLTGTNPSERDVRAHDNSVLARRDPNFVRMADAVFAAESDFKQFDLSYRTHESFHGVRFDWPHDPAGFPSVAFDFGIGLSQFTSWGNATTAICWDWNENLNVGINELLRDLEAAFQPGGRWRDWATRAWGRYNGGDPGGTGAYARHLLASADGQLISVGSVPPGFDLSAQTAPLTLKPPPPPGRPWPVVPPIA